MQVVAFGYKRKEFIGLKSVLRFRRLRIIIIYLTHCVFQSSFLLSYFFYLPFFIALVGHSHFVLTLTWSFLFFI